ncbi:hypothetical protein OS493_009986 [Desmophyllum pertusum]|uniref:Uncharacterized protein n=1 Tax=Desmophyllum pertusum TaxID=174260 RepID=A0A9X0CHS1_9CNID|nr:hypothetical protein OS493_009986 [Desmophyllum pertusum]
MAIKYAARRDIKYAARRDIVYAARRGVKYAARRGVKYAARRGVKYASIKGIERRLKNRPLNLPSKCFFTFQASDDELDDIQATCNDLLQTHEQLRVIVPNEKVKRRLESEATFNAQEWGEVYNREKTCLIKGHFEELRSSLARNIESLDKEWAEVNEQFSTQGYMRTFMSDNQRVLASPDAFHSVEDDFLNLQETKSKLKSRQEEEQFEIVMQELPSRWEEVQRKIEELHLGSRL